MGIQYHIMISCLDCAFISLIRVADATREATIIHIPIIHIRIYHICLCIDSILSCRLLPPRLAIVFGGYFHLQLGKVL